jgi:hypothetical protein
MMTGDELPYPAVSRHQVETLIGDALDADIPTEEVVAALSEKFEPFFLIPDLARRAKCERRWRDLFGDHVICLESPVDTCWAAAGIVALTEGALPDLPAFAKRVSELGVERERVAALTRALAPYAASLARRAAWRPLSALRGAVPRDRPASHLSGSACWGELASHCILGGRSGVW